MDERRVAEVVEAAILEDLRAGFKPDGLRERHAGKGLEELRKKAAEGAEHRPASMDELELPVALEDIRVSGEARRHGALRERPEPFRSVRAEPRRRGRGGGGR